MSRGHRLPRYRHDGKPALMLTIVSVVFLLVLLSLFLSFIPIHGLFSQWQATLFGNSKFCATESPRMNPYPDPNADDIGPSIKSVNATFVTLAPGEFYNATFEGLANTSIFVEYRLAQPHNITILLFTESEFHNWINHEPHEALHEETTSNTTVVLLLQGELHETNYVVLYNDPSLNGDKEVVLSIIHMEATIWGTVATTYTTFTEDAMDSVEQESSVELLASPITNLAVGTVAMVGIVVVTYNNNRKSTKGIQSRIQQGALEDPSSTNPSATTNSSAHASSCPKCKGSVEPGDRFCMNCGASLF